MTDKQESIILERLKAVNGRSYTPAKSIATYVRQDIKAAFTAGELGKDLPEGIKFSVTSTHNKVDVEIKGVPSEWLWEWRFVELYGMDAWRHADKADDLSKAVEAIRDRYNKTHQEAHDVGADYVQRRYYGATDYDWRIREPEKA